MKIHGKNIVKYAVTASVIILAVILFVKYSILKEIIYVLLISFLAAYILKPFQVKLVETGINKSIAALILIGVIALGVLGSLFVVIHYFFNGTLNVKNAVDSIQNMINDIYIKLNSVNTKNSTFYVFTNNIYNRIHTVLIGMSSKICDAAINISGNILYAIIIPIIVYYFLADGKYIKNNLLSLFPVNYRNTVKRIGCHIDKIIGRYILSQLILSLFVGIVTFIILVLLKVEFPFILAIINAFFNIIPYFGPIFGAIPAIFMAFINSPKTAVEVIIWLYVLQQLEGNILCPKITADSISMHPLTVIILLLLGEKTAGFIGMIAAVPLGAAIKIIYKDISYYIF